MLNRSLFRPVADTLSSTYLGYPILETPKRRSTLNSVIRCNRYTLQLIYRVSGKKVYPRNLK